MRRITKGATNQSVVIRIVDDADGTPETGVTSASSGLALSYRREGAALVALTESDLGAADSTHSDGGMIHLSSGYYRVDVPDAAFASGVDGVWVGGDVTDMIVIGTYIELVDAKQTGDSFARIGANGAGLTAVTVDDSTPIEANVKAINDVEIAGNGTSVPWGPA